MKRCVSCIVLVFGICLCQAQEIEIRVHEVQRGESLEYIASHYGVSQSELETYNPFLDRYFYVGQKLNVPIKVKPPVEQTYSSSDYSDGRYASRKKKRVRRGGGWWGNLLQGLGTAFAYGASYYARPMVSPSYPSFSGGSGRMDFLLDPNFAIMQTQQQMAQEQALNQQLMNISLQQVKEQEQQEYIQAKQFRPNLTIEQFRQEKAQMYRAMKEAERQERKENGLLDGGANKGHQCKVCGGQGRVVKETYLGNASQTKWCDICRKEVYVAHHHTSCQTCGGDGWISGY